MYQERRSTSARSLVVIAILAFVCLAVWWLESRFSPFVAVIVIGSLVGAGLVIIGFVLNMASTKYTLNSAAEFNRGLAEVEKYRQMTAREVAKGDSAWHKANAQITVMNERRIDQLAQQRAGLLVDHARQQPQAAEWDWETEDTGADSWNIL